VAGIGSFQRSLRDDGEDEMPKDMRGALIELLETEGDQYDHAWDEALRIF